MATDVFVREGRATDGRKLSRELFGLFLLFWGLLLLLSLLTYDKADPSLNHVVSGAVVVQNGAGLFGAYLGGIMVDVFGFAAFVWPLFFLAWGAGCVSTLITLPWWRWLGFLLLATCLLSLGTAWNLGLGDVRGGGMLGRMLHARGTQLFSPAGSTLIWLFFLFISLEMSFGIPWLELMRRITRFFHAKAQEHNITLTTVSQAVVRALPRPDLSRLPRPRLPLPIGGGVRRARKGEVDGAPLIIDLELIADSDGRLGTASDVSADVPADFDFSDPAHPAAPGSGDGDNARADDAPATPHAPDVLAGVVFRDGPIATAPVYAPVYADEADTDPAEQLANDTADDGADDRAGTAVRTVVSDVPVSPVSPTSLVPPVSPPVAAPIGADDSADIADPFDDVVVSYASWSAPGVTEAVAAPARTGATPSGAIPGASTPGTVPLGTPPREAVTVTRQESDDEPVADGIVSEDLSAFMALTEDAAPAVLEPSVASSAEFEPPVQAGAAPRPRRRARIPMPSLDLLSAPVVVEGAPPSREILASKGARLMACLGDFGIQGELAAITPGPVISMFEIRPAPGVKVSRIVNLSDDLALTLKAMAVRIQAPVPGSDTVGVEIPNEARAVVNFRELLQDASFSGSTSPLNMALGKDIGGHPFSTDLSRMPHMLVAGATGAGKSVCLNSILLSFLYKCTPDDVRILLVDPKRVEMAAYADLPHLVHPVVTEMSMAKTALEWAVHEMETRYDAMARLGVRNIAGFNTKLKELGDNIPRGLEDLHHLPFLVIIIDELADLMMTAGKEIEAHIVRLAQLARAAGIHLIVATQRPSVDVVTGLIKANFPCRISFQVTSKHDSRTILDTVGAEHLLGKGDMLFKPSGGKLQRLHGAFVSDEEVAAVVEYWKQQQAPNYEVDFADWGTEDGGRLAPGDGTPGPDPDGEDALYAEVIAFVRDQGKVSISLIQRRFRIGFNKAARFVEQMEQDGIILPGDRQNKARKVNRGE